MISLVEFGTGRSAVDRAVLLGYFRRAAITGASDAPGRARTRSEWSALLATESSRPT